jgi:chaperonin GroES
MKLKPLFDNILVESIESQEKTTKSGIVLPDSVEKKEQTKGLVIAIGAGKFGANGERLPLSVKVGDKVVFSKPWSEDKKMEENGKKLFLVSEDDILGIIEE